MDYNVDLIQHGVPRVSAVEPTEQSKQKEARRIDAYKELVGQVQERV